MKPQAAGVALIIMAKAPQAGLAKTRLIPALGALGAARLARRLLAHTVDCARATQTFAYIELCVTPSPEHEAFVTLACDIPVTEQGTGDLGQRMRLALERVLQDHSACIMIGTDAPDLTTAHLEQACAALSTHDAVLTPALDGGYALIGVKYAWPALFTDMPWSSAQVMNQTRQRLQQLGLRWHEQAAVSDIDEARDLAHLPTHFLADAP